MAMDQSALLDMLEALKAAEVGDRVRQAVGDRVRQATEELHQELIDAEATAVIGAGPWQRSSDRTVLRNGTRSKTVSTTAGDLELRIPKLRAGSFFPSLLERRRRVDQALFAVVIEAYLHGVSTRKVDDLVKALGADSGISKSEVSRICADLDDEVGAFRDRPLDDIAFLYVFLDATYCTARVNRRVVSQAVVIATGVSADGRREVLGFDVGDTENECGARRPNRRRAVLRAAPRPRRWCRRWPRSGWTSGGWIVSRPRPSRRCASGPRACRPRPWKCRTACHCPVGLTCQHRLDDDPILRHPCRVNEDAGQWLTTS